MKTFFSKPIDTTKLQIRATDNLQHYQKALSIRGRRYAKQSLNSVSRCYVCKSSKKTALITVFGFNYVQCLNCSHVYLSRRLSDSQLSRFYSENESYADTYTDKRQIKYRQEHVAKPKVEFALNQMHFSSNKVKTWLDVGCAVGDVVDVINHIPGWQAMGIDISESSITTGKKIFQSNLRRISFKEMCAEQESLSFNVISFLGYLGLISEPLEELRLARQHTSKGGYLVIGEENASSVSSLVQQSYPNYSSRHLLPPNAVQMFTPKSLELAMVNSGYKPIAKWHFGLDFVEFLKNIALKDKEFSGSPINKFLLAHSNEFQHTIDSLGLSDYMLMIAKVAP